MDQSTQILRYLKAGKTLDALGALDHFGCFRLAARIYDLRCQGWPIETVTVHRGDKTISRYRLKT